MHSVGTAQLDLSNHIVYGSVLFNYVYNSNQLSNINLPIEAVVNLYNCDLALCKYDDYLVNQTRNHITLFHTMFRSRYEKLSVPLIETYHSVFCANDEKYNINDPHVKEEKKESLTEELKLYNSKRPVIGAHGGDLTPLERVVALHNQLIYMEPFEYFNDIIARIILFKELLANNLPLFIIKAEDIELYNKLVGTESYSELPQIVENGQTIAVV